MQELRATISGTVQGVGFRYTLYRHANQLKLSGWVRNRQNGEVELCAQGDKSSLEQLLALIRSRPGQAKIERIDVCYETARTTYPSFNILADE